MTFFQIAVLTLLVLNVWIIYRMLRRLAIVHLMGSFAIARWLNPVKTQGYKENHGSMLAAQEDDEKYEKLSAQLAAEDPECPFGRESLIASAFAAYKECRRIPEKYRKI
jgi:hypothetical protein